MLAVHLENLLFLLFIAVAFLFQLLTRAATKTGQSDKDSEEQRRSPTPSRTSPPRPRAPVETDEDRIRKFLEALGQPPGSKPPPPVVHRTDIPLRPVAPIQPPASMRPFPVPQRRPTPAEERKRTVILQEEPVGAPGDWLRKTDHPGQVPRPSAEKKVFIPKTPEPATFEVHTETTPPEQPVTLESSTQAYAMATQVTSGPTITGTGLTAFLRSNSSLRTAIILREIFGPPRSLQPLELV